MTVRGVTEAYERRMWEELNTLLTDVAEESEGDPQEAIVFALAGGNEEITSLYKQIRELSRRSGYLSDRVEEDTPAAVAIRRLQSGYSDSVPSGRRRC